MEVQDKQAIFTYRKLYLLDNTKQQFQSKYMQFVHKAEYEKCFLNLQKEEEET